MYRKKVFLPPNPGNFDNTSRNIVNSRPNGYSLSFKFRSPSSNKGKVSTKTVDSTVWVSELYGT